MFKVVILLVVVSLGLAQEDISKEDETITKLNLSNKGITSLNDYDFTKYPQLEELDLSNNLIENIKEDKFTKCKNLKKLNLSGNTLLKLPEFSTLLISDIEELNLSNCHIQVFPPSILDGLINLKVVDLSNNPLTSIKLITFSNLLSPQKIILPNLADKNTITEICNELNITIEDNREILKCADVRNGKWESLKKEDDVPKLSDAPFVDTASEEDNTLQNYNISNETSSDEIELSLEDVLIDDIPSPSPIKVNLGDNTTDSSLSSTDLDKSLVAPKSITTHNDTDEETLDVYNAHSSPTVENNKTLETDTDPAQQSIPLSTNLETIENDTNKMQEASSTDANIKPPDTVDNGISKLPQTNEITEVATIPLVSAEAPSNENQQNQQPDKPTVAIQRALPVPSQSVPHPEVSAADTKQAELNKPEDSSEAPTGASTPPSTGTNILIFLVVAVVISGIAAFGYRFYKTRTYRATNTQEPIERELKEIVTDKKSNGPALSNVVEEEPLMLKNENSVEIKEVDETKENHKNDTNHTTFNSKPYVPITSVHTTENIKQNEK